MKRIKYKYGVIYTDGGYRQHDQSAGAGVGIHGYAYDSIEAVRYANVPVLVTPLGYAEKPTGVQLKDDTYNPEYKAFDLSLTLKNEKMQAPTAKGWEGAVVIDGWVGHASPVTAQRAELLAFVNTAECPEVEIENLIVWSDSQYFVNGYNRDAEVWRENGWRKADKSPCQHVDLWERILAFKAERGDTVKVGKIKAHDGHYGNECADRNATYGVSTAMNGNVEDAKWVVTDFNNQEYWNPSKSIPEILRLKWIYDLTGRDIYEWSINSTKPPEDPTAPYAPEQGGWYQYFFGDHNKDKDSVELLGMADPETMLGVAFVKGRVDVIDKISEYHESVMWKDVTKMYQYDTMHLINVSNVVKPKVLWEIENVGMESLWLRNHRNEVISITDSLISMVQRPPKLSYRALEEETALVQILRSAMAQIDVSAMRTTQNAQLFVNMPVIVEDVTDKFYDYGTDKKGETVVKMTDFYDAVAKSVEMDVKNHLGGRTRVILGRNLEIPPRNLMNSLCSENPRAYMVSWQFSSNVFRYAMMITTDSAYSIWAGVYRNYRHIIGDSDNIVDGKLGVEQPLYRHVSSLPIMGKIDVKDLSESIAEMAKGEK